MQCGLAYDLPALESAKGIDSPPRSDALSLSVVAELLLRGEGGEFSFSRVERGRFGRIVHVRRLP